MADAIPRFGALDHLGLAARAAAVDPAADSNVGARGSTRAASEPGGAGVSLGERRFRAKLNLRGDPNNKDFVTAVGAVLDGYHPRIIPNTAVLTDAFHLLWLGPDEWMIVAAAGTEASLAARLSAAVAPHGGTVTDVTESRTTITVSGPRARDVLAKGCPIDLHPRKFNPGDCAQSVVARVGVILMRVDDGTTAVPRFELHVLRSMADYLWRFLEDAGLEYGVTVVEGKD